MKRLCGWMLFAMLAACGEKPGAAPTMPLPVVLPDSYKWLTPDQVLDLQAKTPDLGVLDVRDDNEIHDGNGWIANAQPSSFFANGEARLATLDKERPWLVYCALGGRSELMAKTMAKMGFKQVYLLRGGFIEWRAQKKPVVK